MSWWNVRASAKWIHVITSTSPDEMSVSLLNVHIFENEHGLCKCMVLQTCTLLDEKYNFVKCSQLGDV